jgi:hypothetical protein
MLTAGFGYIIPGIVTGPTTVGTGGVAARAASNRIVFIV